MSNDESGTLTDNSIAHALQAGQRLAGVAPRLLVVAHPDAPDVCVHVGLTDDENGSHVALLEELTAALDARMDGPRLRQGTLVLTEDEGFIDAIKRWGSDATVVYADTARLSFAAVLDDHPAVAAVARWRSHRVTYACPRSPEWLAWTNVDGVAMKQAQFADFIESRLEDLIPAEMMPKPMEMLQLARNLHIKTKGEYQREINPTSGDHVLVVKSETTRDSTQIPRAFMLAIPVFEGGERYQVEARIRFALSEGAGPAFSFTLHRRKEIERDAFNAVRAKVAKATGRLILAGTP